MCLRGTGREVMRWGMSPTDISGNSEPCLGAAAAPLGSLTVFASRTEVAYDESGLVEAAQDYCRRLHARRVAGIALELGGQSRVRDCGHRLVERAKGVGVWRMADRARGRVSGVCLCGSSWACPVCAPRIAAQRVGEVNELADVAMARGYQLGLESYTIPHRQRDSVASCIQRLQDARRGTTSGRAGVILREGRVGYVDAGEITWGAHGSHVHFHRLVIAEAGRYDDKAQETAWLDELESMGRRTRGTDLHAFDFRWLDRADRARYISKVGLETASGPLDTKKSLTPLGMVFRVVDGLLPRHPWLGRFRECVEAAGEKKFAALRFSRGLRKEFGLTEEKTDGELAKEETTETDQLLGYLTEPQWLKIRENRLEGFLVFVAQQGQDAVNSWLKARGLGYLHEGRDELLFDIVRKGEEEGEEPSEQAARDVSSALIARPQLKNNY